ncbi:Histone-lysine N-methyltransferase setd3 [Bagarius yarrelli]|uniref:protein-histidine N-methyltransferase n=1 Tax=Bagarius yarrelli TaxID=175774 RepID=A0A556V5T7_BAGYA|nr:Histone-lysine N-methyltransferase setd3 [Bagarius yarrelli]
MGKKSRAKTQKAGPSGPAATSPKETMNLISELLQKCSGAAPSQGKEWEEYVQIRALVEKIRKKQKGLSVVFEGSREDYFPELTAWAERCGASCEGFEIACFGDEGCGLRATRDYPRFNPRRSASGPLYGQDRILQAMGNVTLALHLLCERATPDSPWQPYIKTLPAVYDTPLYFEEEECATCWARRLSNTAEPIQEHGASVRLLLQSHPLIFRHSLTHLPRPSSQIYIFYGTRSNAEFVVHNGFFFEGNAHDRVKIKLGVSKSERLYAMKAEVLARAGIPASSVFALHGGDPPVSAQLLAFLRVFCMTEEELCEYLAGDRAIDKIVALGNADFPVSWENEIKLWTFLETRAALLLKTYKTTSEEDRASLQNPDLSPHARMAARLRLAEKEILERAATTGRAERLRFGERLREGAVLPVYRESHATAGENEPLLNGDREKPSTQTNRDASEIWE